jgi:hypothetical protein
LQTHAGGRTHASGDPGDDALSPEVQAGVSPGLHVMVHFGHGGGPTALQEAGWVRFHPGVALGDGRLGIGIGAWAIVVMGESQTARNKMRAAIIVAFLKSCAPAIT